MGLWAMRASHSTATMSSGGTRGLYGLRFMHRLNIFLSRFGPRAGRAPFLSQSGPNPNLTNLPLQLFTWLYIYCSTRQNVLECE
ncbi:hypothetical protein BGY98DRAFT_955444 [Russula aff. rugulosa BPL654]|nr:hypothetical protein BGY98DRAFT_955444 [Russula aff. rugulosa BPL654]